MNKLFKKVLAGVLACSMLGSMSAVALADGNSVKITKVEVLSSADDTNPTTYTGDSLNNASFTVGKLIRITAKTTNSNTSPYMTFLSYKNGSESSLNNTTVQYVAQDAATSGTEQTFTFRPRATLGAGKYTAKVGATGVTTPVSITYTVNGKINIKTPDSAISFAKNNVPESIKFNFETENDQVLNDGINNTAEIYIDGEKVTVTGGYEVKLDGSGGTTTEGIIIICKAALESLGEGTHNVTLKVNGFEDATLTNAFTVTGEAYNVTFDTNGGELESNVTGSFTANEAETALPIPKKAHKKFDGWYLSDDTNYTTKIEKYASNLDNKTLVAKWTDITHTITYVGNVGATVVDGATLPATYVEGTAVTLPNLTKTGHTFGGWFTSTDYETEIEISSETITDVTAYAKFTANTYTFKYMSNDKEYKENGKDTYTYGDTNFTFPTPTGEGIYPEDKPNFVGWYTDSDFADGTQVGSPIEAVANAEDGDAITLYAKWTASAKYTLNLNYRAKDKSVLSGIAGEVVPNIITYKDDNYKDEGYDYTFVGWADTQGATTAISDEELKSKTFPEGESNLYPVFSKSLITYTVKFVVGDDVETGYENNELQYTVNTDNNLPNATKEGFKLEGWYKEESCINKVKNWSYELYTGDSTEISLYPKFVEKWDDVEQLSATEDVKVTKRGNTYKVTKTEAGSIDNYVGYAVLYNENGTLKSVTPVKAENTNEFTITLPTPTGQETGKLFIWKKTNAKPVIGAVAVSAQPAN